MNVIEKINDINKNTSINISILISEIEIRPVLYLKHLHKKQHIEKILENWDEIAAVLLVKRDHCINTWKKILNIYLSLHDMPYTLKEDILKSWKYDEIFKNLFLNNYEHEELVDSFDSILETSYALPDKRVIASNNENIGEVVALDNEELFLLSCVPNLTRLPAEKNALARLEILKLLYKIEHDTY